MKNLKEFREFVNESDGFGTSPFLLKKEKDHYNYFFNLEGKNEDEGRAIGICKKSVITRKKIKIFTFNCKKTAKLNAKKGTRKLIVAKIFNVLP
jgi:hypothetical protein